MSSSRKLHLDKRNAMFGGVCAGIANYFDIDRLIVRIITIIATLTWWPTVLAYIALCFVLSGEKPNFKEMGENISNTRIGRHFRKVDYKKRIYKSRSDRKISGVCAGLANYFEISPFIVRAGTLLSLFFGPFAIIGYIIAAVIMDPDPNEVDRRPSGSDRRRQRRQRRRQQQYQDDYVGPELHSKSIPDPEPAFDKRDLHECTEKFSNLEKKLQRLEATITSKKFKLHSEFKRMAT